VSAIQTDIEEVALLGLGLMGGSLAAGIRRAGARIKIHAYARRESTRLEAMETGCVDAVYADPAEAVVDADIVICCTPISTIPGLMKACLPGLSPGTTVTDVGSTKVQLQAQLEALLSGGAAYVGSHPMCGSEKTGLSALIPDLYEDARVVIVPPRQAGTGPHLERVRELWTMLGSDIIEMDAESHDRLVARTSHLPHLVAAGLVAAVTEHGVSDALRALCGRGFRDTTRIAAGSAKMWGDIVSSNRENIRGELVEMQRQLKHMIELIDEGDMDTLETYLHETAEIRKVLRS
jgi:cyclohexadieny/prephenate dehydrogenase